MRTPLNFWPNFKLLMHIMRFHKSSQRITAGGCELIGDFKVPNIQSSETLLYIPNILLRFQKVYQGIVAKMV